MIRIREREREPRIDLSNNSHFIEKELSAELTMQEENDCYSFAEYSYRHKSRTVLVFSTSHVECRYNTVIHESPTKLQGFSQPLFVTTAALTLLVVTFIAPEDTRSPSESHNCVV